MAYTTPQWANWGLCIVDSVRARPGELARAFEAHGKVADYLDSHFESAMLYRPDQRGELKYYDILKLAGGD